MGKETEYIAEAIASRAIASDGVFTRRCAGLLEERFGIHRVLMTPSCTAALEMAAILCDLLPGDEVILPSYTFVSTANAFVRLGARPVFVDIRPDTLNLDETLIEALITPRTRAIFPVHYAGVACAMDRIMEIARAHDLLVVEDAAQAVNAFDAGRALGSIGHLGTYSFHETKNVVCGEGGALCCNTPEMVNRAEIIRDKGTNRSQFFRGEVDKYTWIDVGSSYIPSEIACAFLYAQLEVMDAISARRREVDRFYRYGLGPLAEAGRLRLSYVPDGCETHHRDFYILLDDGPTRDALIAHLRENGVSATFHFIPLHSSPMGKRFGYREGDMPVTEEMSRRILRLPSYADISEDEQARVVDLVTAFLEGGHRNRSGERPHSRRLASSGTGGAEPRSACLPLSRHACEPDLSIVIPVYRSEDCLEPLVAAIEEASDTFGGHYEVILVNDGSPDRSWAIVEGLCRDHPNVVGVDLRRNFGQDNAIMTGLRLARGRCVAIMDDDLQHHPRDLPALIAKIQEGADVAYAHFPVKRQKAWKNLGSWFNGKVAEWVLGKPKGVYMSPYKVLRKEVADLVCRYDGPDPYLDGLLFQVTSRFAQVPVEHHARFAGAGNYNLWSSVAVWARLATSSVRPLRLVTWCGLALGASGALLAASVILYRLACPAQFEAAVAGWASLMVALLVIGGVQMVFLGVLGEYAGRTHTTVAGKPQAAIREVLNAGARRADSEPQDIEAETAGGEPWQRASSTAAPLSMKVS